MLLTDHQRPAATVLLLTMKKTTKNTSFSEMTHIVFKLSQSRYRISKTIHVYIARFNIFLCSVQVNVGYRGLTYCVSCVKKGWEVLLKLYSG